MRQRDQFGSLDALPVETAASLHRGIAFAALMPEDVIARMLGCDRFEAEQVQADARVDLDRLRRRVP